MFRHKKTNFIGVSPARMLQKVCYFSHNYYLFSFVSWCCLKFHVATTLSLNNCLLRNHPQAIMAASGIRPTAEQTKALQDCLCSKEAV
jgi:hypothetical protein